MSVPHADPPATGARQVTGSIAGVDGTRRAWRATVASQARATLILVHGLGDHAGRYDEFAARMASFRISTYAMDLRGHGRSEGRRGHLPAFDACLRELDEFRREVEALSPARTPLFLLGQSLGGLIALRYLQEYDGAFRGAVIASPWLATAVRVPRWKTVLAPLVGRLFPALPFRHGIDAAQLSRDRAVQAAYHDDALVQPFITPRTFSEVSRAMDRALQQGDRIRAPLLFMLGDADRLVDGAVTLRFARAMANPDITIRVHPGCLHELLLEIDRAAIHGEVGEWIVSRI